MAVPYEACDKPNERSEFKQPEVAIVKSFLSYHRSGITEPQLLEVMAALTDIGRDKPSVRDMKFKCAPRLPLGPASAGCWLCRNICSWRLFLRLDRVDLATGRCTKPAWKV